MATEKTIYFPKIIKFKKYVVDAIYEPYVGVVVINTTITTPLHGSEILKFFTHTIILFKKIKITLIMVLT